MIPSKSKKIIAVLEYIVQDFEYGNMYREGEINTKLRCFHPDTTTIRRLLIDYGFLDREKDGRHIWRQK